jgi:hypothetical protein
MRRLLLAAALAACAAAPAEAGWNAPGGALDADPAADARTPALAVAGGEPITAWVEGAAPDTRIRVTGGHVLGTAGRWAIEPDAAVIGGVLHVAWSERDSDGTYDVRVAALREEAFVPVGAPIDLVAGSDARDPSLADAGGEPHVAWTEGDSQNLEVRVARFDGTGWRSVGGLVNASSRAAAAAPLAALAPAQENGQDPDLAVVGGVLHVAWDEGGAARVARLSADRGSWSDVGGGPANASGSAAQVSLAAVGGEPHLAWRSAEGRFVVRAARAAGGTWVPLGEVGAGGEPSLAVDAGTAWIAWVAGDGVRVARLSGSAWTQPQDVRLNRQSVARGPSLDFVSGIPFVAFSEGLTTSAGDVRVARLEPDVLATEVTATATGATLLARVRAYGLRYPVAFAYGAAGTGLPLRSASGVADGEEDEVVAVIGGLAPRTAYEAQAVATAGAGPEVRGPVVAFTTPKRNGK